MSMIGTKGWGWKVEGCNFGLGSDVFRTSMKDWVQGGRIVRRHAAIGLGEYIEALLSLQFL
jgi:hypothetical protein